MVGIDSLVKFNDEKSKVDINLKSSKEEEEDYNSHSGGKYYKSVSLYIHFTGNYPFRVFCISISASCFDFIYIKDKGVYHKFSGISSIEKFKLTFKNYKIMMNKSGMLIPDLGISVEFQNGKMYKVDFYEKGRL